jgi:hypothetical protein
MSQAAPRVSKIGIRANGGLPDRYPTTQANPIGNTAHITRETLPVSGVATPRWKHPKLNATPWSMSYAVKRTPISPGKAKKVRHG